MSQRWGSTCMTASTRKTCNHSPKRGFQIFHGGATLPRKFGTGVPFPGCQIASYIGMAGTFCFADGPIHRTVRISVKCFTTCTACVHALIRKEADRKHIWWSWDRSIKAERVQRWLLTNLPPLQLWLGELVDGIRNYSEDDSLQPVLGRVYCVAIV